MCSPNLLLRAGYNKDATTLHKVSYKKDLAPQKTKEQTYASSVFVEFCAGCIDVDGTYKDLPTVVRGNVRSMLAGDFITLFVCSLAVGLAVAGEVRDVKIATMAQKRSFHKTQHHRVSHVWFAALNFARLYVLVPQVVAAVPNLVALEGADAVAILFNTVAVVFVVELDNVLTTRLLSAPTLGILRKNAAVVPDRADQRYLSMTQKIVVVLVVLFSAEIKFEFLCILRDLIFIF